MSFFNLFDYVKTPPKKTTLFDKDPTIEDYITFAKRSPISCFVVGSYVYHHIVQKEPHNSDIDLVVDTKRQDEFACKLRKEMSCHSFIENDYSMVSYRVQCPIQSFNKINIDVMCIITYKQMIKEHGVSMINSLYMDTYGNIRDIEDNEDRRNFTISSLQRKEYCRFSSMRPKDVAYFKDFKVIDPEICEKFGYLFSNDE